MDGLSIFLAVLFLLVPKPDLESFDAGESGSAIVSVLYQDLVYQLDLYIKIW